MVTENWLAPKSQTFSQWHL